MLTDVLIVWVILKLLFLDYCVLQHITMNISSNKNISTLIWSIITEKFKNSNKWNEIWSFDKNSTKTLEKWHFLFRTPHKVEIFEAGKGKEASFAWFRGQEGHAFTAQQSARNGRRVRMSLVATTIRSRTVQCPLLVFHKFIT